MSKQSEAKERQGYTPKAIPIRQTCANCVNYKSDITEKAGIFGGVYRKESNRRCTLGGFAVKKSGTCLEWFMTL